MLGVVDLLGFVVVDLSHLSMVDSVVDLSVVVNHL